MFQPTVSAGLLSGLLDYAHDRGVERAILEDLCRNIAGHLGDPDNRAPLDIYLKLMKTAAEELDDPAFFLHFAEEVAMSDISIVGLIMEASETMADAFEQLQRYGRLAAETTGVSDGPAYSLEMKEERLYLVDQHSEVDTFPELIESAFVRLTCGPRRFLSKPHVLSVFLTRSAPVWRSEYERIFDCPVFFDASRNALELHRDVAQWRVAQNPRYVFGVLTNRGEQLLADLDTKKTVAGQVEAILLSVLHEGEASAEMVAVHLGHSRQTLFRRLKEEGTTFAKVYEALRLRLAKEYLSCGAASVSETAYLVGFSDPAAFSRAFKRWTGSSPRAFRKDTG